MVNVCDGPEQLGVPFENDGVTVIVAVIGAVPLFVGVNTGMFPVPEAASPIPVLEFVQE